MKSQGPSFVPWGTPHSEKQSLDSFTRWRLSMRKSQTQRQFRDECANPGFWQLGYHDLPGRRPFCNPSTPRAVMDPRLDLVSDSLAFTSMIYKRAKCKPWASVSSNLGNNITYLKCNLLINYLFFITMYSGRSCERIPNCLPAKWLDKTRQTDLISVGFRLMRYRTCSYMRGRRGYVGVLFFYWASIY